MKTYVFSFLFSLCIWLLGVTVSDVFGQSKPPKKNWEGYLITLKGDTLKGTIRHKTGEEIKEKVNVKVNDTLKFSFKMAEILEFTSGDEHYITGFLEPETPRVPLRVLSQGRLFLLEYQTLLMNGGNQAIRYEIYAFNPKDSAYTLIRPITWKKQLEGLMADAPEMQSVMDKTKYKFEEIKLVFDQYNMMFRGREEEEQPKE